MLPASPPGSPEALGGQPLVSVVVPTYNRSALLHRTLDALAGQDLPTSDFEVIVADDGSCDDTREVVRRYRERLRLRYYFQDDRGFRAGAARNGGARLASAPILAFLDTGVLAGPGWVRAHLAIHRSSQSPGRAALGYVYGYDPSCPCAELAELAELDELAERLSPAEIRTRLADLPSFRDLRHTEFSLVEFDLSRLAVPWYGFFALNVSLPARIFWSVGGFDEDFQGWGMEDLELGFRLSQRGFGMTASRQAWAIEAPHPRTTASNLDSNRRNISLFLEKHPHPLAELYWIIHTQRTPHLLEDEYQALLAWQRKSADLDVVAELTSHTSRLPAGRDGLPAVAVFGCGAAPPDRWSAEPARYTLCDFDSELLPDPATHPSGSAFDTVHAAGVRTPLPDDSFDLVIITSRLVGLWPQWGAAVLGEARRIGREVRMGFQPCP